MSDRHETDELVEAMAREIWADQRSKIAPDALSRTHDWRATSVPDRYWRGFYSDARAALTALHGQGYAVVPVKPTLEMQNAAWRWFDEEGYDVADMAVAPPYRAMCTASPIGRPE